MTPCMVRLAISAAHSSSSRYSEVNGSASKVGPGFSRRSAGNRLPADLRENPGPTFDALPFTSLYLLDDEWAAEIANRTMHGVMHLGWVPDGTGGYCGQMAVLVKPN